MMKKYEIGLYEKAMRNTLSWSEKLKCAKECGYDYMEMCIDATDEKINRIFMNTAEKKEMYRPSSLHIDYVKEGGLNGTLD